MRRWMLLAVFLLSIPAVTARIYASDEVEGFSWLHSLFFDRDVSFENEYEYFYNSGQVKNSGFHETFLEDRYTATGRRPNFTTMGAALLWSPFYGLGHLGARLSGKPADGLSLPYIYAVAVGSALYGFLALWFAMAAATRVLGTSAPLRSTVALRTGPLAGLAVWLGTPLLFYMYVTPIFAHACSAFAVALFLWVWLRVREEWSLSGAFALGLAAGLMTIVRMQDALFLVGPALDFVRSWSRRRERAAPWPAGLTSGVYLSVLASAVGFALVLLPQLLAFKALNGQFSQSELETRKMSWSSPHGLQVLFDSQHGLFFWTPLAVLALAGLVILALRPAADDEHRRSDARWMGWLTVLMFLLQAYISGAVESWTVAGAFGQRRFVSLTPLLVLGVAALMSAMASAGKPARRLGLAAIVLATWWNLGLMAQFGLHTMDRERLTLGANAWQTFVTLPLKAPALAWQYLTDRTSFYNRPQQAP